MRATALFLSPPPLLSTPTPLLLLHSLHPLPFRSLKPNTLRKHPLTLSPSPTTRSFLVRADDGDGDSAGPDDYDMDDEELEEVDNKKDFDIEYDTLAAAAAAAAAANGEEDIAMVQSKSFVFTQGWDSEMVVDYRINEDEFHKISLLDCDFFIRKPPDPDNDVYDFREMYVTPPDTDVYAIPRVLAPMPQKYIRCAKSDFSCYNVTEPPIDAPRDPLYKSERDVLKVYLTKHYRNRRLGDPDFVLDFEEIYVLDSKIKSISRAKVLVSVLGGRSRDRRHDLLVIRDNGNSFRIVHGSEKDDPTTVIEREEWNKTRQDMERHLSKLRDFNVSNWF
ncbi:PLASTID TRANSCRIPTIONALLY ACTIVE protein 6, chloroplastic [Pyrus x bretschneideri]|uniref:PLASTID TRANSCRIPTIONALLY ACTIVE protein 6, chloroplastic n=1 Tax=Pyrus x bretschneideri TaxID=225117 RepID=UPI002030C1F3|nr:PLASTID TRANSCRIPTIONALLY ACTIVE protein 6, chloroplastic [Pyrus x bretschneideri]